MSHPVTTRLLVLSSSACLSAPAVAQETLSITLTHGLDSNVVEIGQVVTWTLTMEHVGFNEDASILLLNAGLHASTDLGETSDFAYAGPFNGGTNGGDVTNDSFDIINFNNLIFGGFGPVLNDNPLVVGSFTTTIQDTGHGPLTYSIRESTIFEGSFASVSTSGFNAVDFSIDQVDFTSDFVVIPSPAPIAAVSLAMLAAATRRRP